MSPHVVPTAEHLATILPPVLEASTHGDTRGPGEPAGVMIVLFDHLGAAHMLLTKRTEYPGHHSGEISLPGGRYEQSDADLLATALRETHEEVGIAAHTLTVLGALPHVETRISGFTVQPWVGHHPGGRPHITLDPSEVARVMDVPLADLVAADHLLPPNPPLNALRYPLLGENVWGLTARILHMFTAVVRDATAA